MTDPLFALPDPPRRPRGRHEREVNKALLAAGERGLLDDTHGGLIATVRALARALDGAEAEDRADRVIAVSRELRAALGDARLLPSASAAADPFDALLDTLNNADAPRP